MEVIKRNGTKQQFDANKIINAIKGAYEDLGKPFDDEAERRAQDIAAHVEKLNRDVAIEEIQDIVENKLMASNCKDVARAYIRYRYKREWLDMTINNLWMPSPKKLRPKMFKTKMLM